MAEDNEVIEQSNDLRQLEAMADDLEPENDIGGGVNPENDIGGDVNPPELSTEEVLSMAFTPLFELLAPNWNIKEDEIKILCGAYAPVIDKYFGGVSMGVELQAVVVTAMVIAPRLSVPRVVEPVKTEDVN